jgi:hypothetical protein
MAYTICDLHGNPKPIRLVMWMNDAPHIGEAFTPYWWACDPCNGSANRYELTFRADQDKPCGYAWYQVLTSDDSQNDIDAKLAHYAKVIDAHKALEEARRQFERLNS